MKAGKNNDTGHIIHSHHFPYFIHFYILGTLYPALATLSITCAYKYNKLAETCFVGTA